jgi:hypothetical protein
MPDSITVIIPDGYLGQCVAGIGMTCRNDATHMEFHPFDPPLETTVTNERLVAAGLDPMLPVEGVWEGICDEHCDKTRKHKED